MQFSTTTIIALFTAATAVVAAPSAQSPSTIFKRDNCDTRYTYCGHSLMKKGRYANQILAALDAAKKPHTQFEDALFGCIGGPNGDIKYIQFCGTSKCHDAGSNHDDTCF